MGDRIILCKVLLGLPEGKGSLERPSRKWEDNINMDLQGAECRCMDWIEKAHDKDMVTYDCGNETSGVIKCGEILFPLHE